MTQVAPHSLVSGSPVAPLAPEGPAVQLKTLQVKVSVSAAGTVDAKRGTPWFGG